MAAPSHLDAIAVDPAFIAYEDSSYDTSSEKSEMTSLASTVYRYIVENGRHYHAFFGTDKNIMPIDEV
jgi:hypothetical protein